MKDQYEMDNRNAFNNALKKLKENKAVKLGKTQQRVKLTYDPVHKEGVEKRKHEAQVKKNKKVRDHEAEIKRNKNKRMKENEKKKADKKKEAKKAADKKTK